jgi:hypothetical protein
VWKSKFAPFYWTLTIRRGIRLAAVRKDEEAFQNERTSAAEGFQKIGFHPVEIMKT